MEKSIKIDGEEIQGEREARFLGILLKEEMNFDMQQKEVKEKMIKVNGLLKYME